MINTTLYVIHFLISIILSLNRSSLYFLRIGNELIIILEIVYPKHTKISILKILHRKKESFIAGRKLATRVNINAIIKVKNIDLVDSE